jgi:hypothetical protein
MKILMDEQPLDDGESVMRFISDVKASKSDGLLLIPFKKGHWGHVTRIVDETQTPSVVLATLGILLVDHINQFHEKQGVYLINSMDNLDAVEEGMNMIRTARWMREAVLTSGARKQKKPRCRILEQRCGQFLARGSSRNSTGRRLLSRSRP